MVFCCILQRYFFCCYGVIFFTADIVELNGVEGVESCPQELQPFIPAIYECALVRLRATDMDQEVKERAIAACGQLLCHFGDYLQVS